MLENPLVSIVMPTYNRAKLILETIESVLHQSYPHWELIIVDDGSDDETEFVVNAISNSKIKYFRIAHTGLLGKVRNVGIEKSSGQYIAFLDSDDLWRRDKLEFQLSLLIKYSNSKFCFSNGDQSGPSATLPADAIGLATGNLFESMLFKCQFPLYMPSLMVSTDIFNSIDMLNEKYRSGADIDFFYRLAFKYEGVFTNEKLINIRKEPGSNSDKFSELSYLELIDMYDEFFQMGMITGRQKKNLKSDTYYRLARHQQINGNEKNAIKNFLHYSSLRPLDWKGWTRTIQSWLRLIRI
jgi:glycosyltransferase involved in cell wall biosynthesis